MTMTIEKKIKQLLSTTQEQQNNGGSNKANAAGVDEMHQCLRTAYAKTSLTVRM